MVTTLGLGPLANPALGLPLYKVEINLTGATNGWVLGISTLGAGTILRASPTTGAVLGQVAGFLAASIRRGRNDALAPIQAGTMHLVMDNDAGWLSPDNAASPYYPNVVPRRQVRLSAKYTAGSPWTPLFYGYIDSIKPVDNGPASSNVEIEASDWLARAAVPTVNGARGDETDAARFAWLAGQIGTDNLPTAVVGPAGGVETVAGITYAEVAGLTALQQVADTTLGTIYHAANGTITYRTRFGRFTAPGVFAAGGYQFDQPNLSPGATVCPYTSLDYAMDVTQLYNEIKVTDRTGGVATASDSASQTRYGRLTLDRNLPLLNSGRASDQAAYLLAAYKDAYARVRGIVIDGDAGAGPQRTPLWDVLVNIELGDTVRVVKRQPGNLGIDRTMFVEGIQHDIAAAEYHRVTLQTSDVRQAGVAPWVLGTSQLGRSTYLSY